LYLDGLMYRQQGDLETACTSFAKALLLLRAATASASALGVSYPEAEARIEELLGLMDGSNGQ